MFARHKGRLLASLGAMLTAGCLTSNVPNAAASIAGTVTPASVRAKVYAVFALTTDTAEVATADTLTGAYKLVLLLPAAYTLSAVGSNNFYATKSVTVAAAQNLTGVNFP